MWFGWNRFGWGPWGPGFGPMYGPYGGYPPYGGGYGAPYGSAYPSYQYGPQYGPEYDPRMMELMAMREELEFMSQRVNEILARVDEIEREMRQR